MTRKTAFLEVVLVQIVVLVQVCLYYLSVHYHSCCFYIQHHGRIREITFMPVYLFCFKLCSVLLTCWRNIRLFYTAFILMVQKRSRFEPASQSTFCSCAHVQNFVEKYWNWDGNNGATQTEFFDHFSLNASLRMTQ